MSTSINRVLCFSLVDIHTPIFWAAKIKIFLDFFLWVTQ
jgi:hypothetical protein